MFNFEGIPLNIYRLKSLYRNKKKKSYIYKIDKSKNNFNYVDKGKSPGGRN